MATPPVITQRNVSSGMDSDRLARAVRLNLFAVGLLAGCNRVVQRVLLAVDDVAALVNHLARGFAQPGSLFFQILLALIGFAQQDIACLLARFRCEKESDADADP